MSDRTASHILSFSSGDRSFQTRSLPSRLIGMSSLSTRSEQAPGLSDSPGIWGSLLYWSSWMTGRVSLPNSLRSSSTTRSPFPTASFTMDLLRPTSFDSEVSWKSPTAPTTASQARSTFAGSISFDRRYVMPAPQASKEPSIP